MLILFLLINQRSQMVLLKIKNTIVGKTTEQDQRDRSNKTTTHIIILNQPINKHITLNTIHDTISKPCHIQLLTIHIKPAKPTYRQMVHHHRQMHYYNVSHPPSMQTSPTQMHPSIHSSYSTQPHLYSSCKLALQWYRPDAYATLMFRIHYWKIY